MSADTPSRVSPSRSETATTEVIYETFALTGDMAKAFFDARMEAVTEALQALGVPHRAEVVEETDTWPRTKDRRWSGHITRAPSHVSPSATETKDLTGREIHVRGVAADEELLRTLREEIRASGESDEVRLFSPFAGLIADALDRWLPRLPPRSPSATRVEPDETLTERELQLTVLAVMDALDANAAFLDADPAEYARIIKKLQRMKKFSLGQAWVSRVTAEDAPDVE